MTRPGLLERAVKILSKDYIKLELWSESRSQEDLLPYAEKIVTTIERAHPGTHVLWHHRAKVDYFWAGSGFHCSSGYRFYVSRTVDPVALKRTCMRLELDPHGERMADIDVYCENRKVSRRRGPYAPCLLPSPPLNDCAETNKYGCS